MIWNVTIISPSLSGRHLPIKDDCLTLFLSLGGPETNLESELRRAIDVNGPSLTTL